MSYTYRCGSAPCRAQKTFKRPIDPERTKCANCGGDLHPFRRDKARDKTRSCHCGALPFDAPHRAGSTMEYQGRIFYCQQYKGDQFTDELIRELGAATVKSTDEPPF